MEISKAELAALFKQDREKAFRWLYHNYYRELLGFAKGIVGLPQDAEDIIGETMIKLWEEERATFESAAQIRSWLFTTTRNACIDFLRTKKRNIPHIIDLDADVTDESSRDLSVKSTIASALFLATKQLPEIQRKIIDLLVYENLEVAEIAVKLNMPESTVRSNKRHAVENLRKLISLENLLVFMAIFKSLEFHSLNFF